MLIDDDLDLKSVVTWSSALVIVSRLQICCFLSC
jgi:hypothetical protein